MRLRPLVIVSLMVAILVTATTSFAAYQQATPVAIPTDSSNATPETSPETETAASPSPAATPAFTQADCDAYSEWEHVALFEQFAPFSFAVNEAGLGVGAPDPAEIDLEPAIARQVAEKADTFLEAYREIVPPPIAQDVSENFGANIESLSVALRDYADAVESGADPDQEFNALLERAAATAAETNSDAELAVVIEACDPNPGTPAANSAIQQGRDLATAAKAASQALSSAGAPQVAQGSNKALIEFFDAVASAASEYADRLKAVEDYRTVTDEVTGALVPLGLSANEQLQTTLERCGISIGVDEPDDGNPPLSESDCEEFFSWYQATADLLADYDALSIEAGVPSLEFGLILPGGYGSPDLSIESGDDEATPTQDTSPVASPATSPTPSPVGSPSPAATPHYTAQECADWREYNNRQFETTDDFLVAAIELRQLYSSTGEPPSADTVSPEAAREWADTLDASIREYTSIDVPAVAQDQHDAGLAARTAISDALRDFADAVEGGADRNQAIVQFLYNNPAVADPGNRQRVIIDQFQAACYQGADEDAETFREYARKTENALEVQSTARTPRVAREANDAFVEALEAFDAVFLEYADRIEGGEDREMLTAELGAKILEPSIAATEAMRDLLERCGIAIGITEPDDGQPPLSNGQCKQVFRWYEDTADRMTDLVATDFPFLESGLVVPGGLGPVDLDNLS